MQIGPNLSQSVLNVSANLSKHESSANQVLELVCGRWTLQNLNLSNLSLRFYK